jgi:hypothetical protein
MTDCSQPNVLVCLQGKLTLDGMYLSNVEKGDLKETVFVVQYDIENCYMWVMKLKPENALGKMQLRSYMNGHEKYNAFAFAFVFLCIFCILSYALTFCKIILLNEFIYIFSLTTRY